MGVIFLSFCKWRHICEAGPLLLLCDPDSAQSLLHSVSEHVLQNDPPPPGPVQRAAALEQGDTEKSPETKTTEHFHTDKTQNPPTYC